MWLFTDVSSEWILNSPLLHGSYCLTMCWGYLLFILWALPSCPFINPVKALVKAAQRTRTIKSKIAWTFFWEVPLEVSLCSVKVTRPLCPFCFKQSFSKSRIEKVIEHVPLKCILKNWPVVAFAMYCSQIPLSRLGRQMYLFLKIINISNVGGEKVEVLTYNLCTLLW